MGEIYRKPAVGFRSEEYVRVQSVEEAFSYLKKYGEEARIIGGGITLHELGVMGSLSRVKKLIDIQQLKLDYINSEDRSIKIGASTPVYKIRDHEVFRTVALRALAEASDFVPVQVVNNATIGGEICTGLPILSLPPALLALDSSVKCVSADGERIIPLDNFYVDYFLTELRSDELVKEISIPVPSAKTGSAFKYEKITAADYPMGSVAVRFSIDQRGKCTECRVSTGSLCRIPMRAKKTEKMLEGTDLNKQTLDKAANEISKEIDPISDLRASADYRRRLARVLFVETAEIALNRTKM